MKRRARMLLDALEDGCATRDQIFAHQGRFSLLNNAAAELRAAGIPVGCGIVDGEYSYWLLSDGLACSPSLPPVAEQPVESLEGSVQGEQVGCVRGDSSPEGLLANPGAPPEQLSLVAA